MATGGGENYSDTENESEKMNKNLTSKFMSGLESDSSPGTPSTIATTTTGNSRNFVFYELKVEDFIEYRILG